jgi:hypothetical protein
MSDASFPRVGLIGWVTRLARRLDDGGDAGSKTCAGGSCSTMVGCSIDLREKPVVVIESVLKADVRCILSKGWSDRLGDPASTKTEIPGLCNEVR